MTDTAPVYFEGNWSPPEREVVEAAVAEAESADLPEPTGELGAPWVATRQDVGVKCLYMASRQQTDDTLMDQSADGLAARIRRFADRAAPDSSPGLEAGPAGAASLFQLIYVSEATAPMSEVKLRALLYEARTRNGTLDITGLLLHARNKFLQVLEGSEEAVRDLYDAIRTDPRHTNVEVLLTTTADERTFPDWRMGVEDLQSVAAEEGGSSFLQTGTLPPSVEPMAEVLDALQQFKGGEPF
jgi:hypothetical protein